MNAWPDLTKPDTLRLSKTTLERYSSDDENFMFDDIFKNEEYCKKIIIDSENINEIIGDFTSVKSDSINSLINEKYKYKKTGEEEFISLYGKFLKNISDVLSVLKGSIPVDIGVCEDTVIKIIDLVRKRKLYFHVYHNIEDLNELKEISLYCFWILKLQPFYWLDNNGKSNHDLNTTITLRLLIKFLYFYVTKINRKNEEENTPAKFNTYLTRSIIQNLYYTFCYRDWSKEAIMDLVEGLIVKMKK
jgi:hypothetical protein